MGNKIPQFTYGADPEFFVCSYIPEPIKEPPEKGEGSSSAMRIIDSPKQSKLRNRQRAQEILQFSRTLDCDSPYYTLIPFSELGICSGTKGKALPILPGSDHQASWLVDGATCEINLPPARFFADLCTNLRDAERLANLTLAQSSLLSGGIVALAHAAAEARFSAKDLAIPIVGTLGCSPDKLAFSNQDRPALADFMINPWRFAGRHIHVGLNPWPENLPKFVAVRVLTALYVGSLPMWYASRRSKWYGIPGLYRETPYGVELRFPDDSWWHETHHSWARNWEKFVKKVVEGYGDELARWHEEVPWEELENKFLEENSEDIGADTLDTYHDLFCKETKIEELLEMLGYTELEEVEQPPAQNQDAFAEEMVQRARLRRQQRAGLIPEGGNFQIQENAMHLFDPRFDPPEAPHDPPQQDDLDEEERNIA